MGFAAIICLFGLYFCDPVEYSPLSLRNVMYYGDWSSVRDDVLTGKYVPSLIQAGQITHLNFAFLDLDAEGNIVLTDADAASRLNFGVEGVSVGDPNAGILPALQDLRAIYPNMRLGVSVGGWTRSGDFALVANDTVKRARFVDQAIKFIEYNNFDFIDIDWEYPGDKRDASPADDDEGAENTIFELDGKNYIQLLKDLKTKKDELATKTKRVYELSVALPAQVSTFMATAQAYFPTGVTLAGANLAERQTAAELYLTELFETIDFGNIMTYDLTGSWMSTTAHHSPLYVTSWGKTNSSADTIVSYLLGKTQDSKLNPLTEKLKTGVVPPQKICVGAAFYTHGWNTVADTAGNANPGLYETCSIVRPWVEQYGYGTLDKLKAENPGLTYYYDAVAEAPYLYKPGGPFFTYDSPKSVTAKAKYVKDNNLGGIINWMASQDAAVGTEDTGSYAPGDTRSVLTSAIKTGLFGAAALQEFIIHPDPLVVSGVVDVDVATKEFKINITNNNAAIEFSEDADKTKNGLYYSARTSKTIIVPKLYITLKSGVSVVADTANPPIWSQTGSIVTVNLYAAAPSYLYLYPGDTASIKLPVTKDGDLVSEDIAKIEISKQIYKNSAKVVGRVDVTVNYIPPGGGAQDVGLKRIGSRAMMILMALTLLIAGMGGGF